MPRADQNIEILLEQQLQYHLEHALRCRRALTAYRGEEDATAQNKPLGWAAAIDEIFQQHGQLSVEELRGKLVEKGLPAQDDQHLNTIRSTLARKAGEGGTLVRVSSGVYKYKVHGEIGQDDGDNKSQSPAIVRRPQRIIEDE